MLAAQTKCGLMSRTVERPTTVPSVYCRVRDVFSLSASGGRAGLGSRLSSDARRPLRRLAAGWPADFDACRF